MCHVLLIILERRATGVGCLSLTRCDVGTRPLGVSRLRGAHLDDPGHVGAPKLHRAHAVADSRAGWQLGWCEDVTGTRGRHRGTDPTIWPQSSGCRTCEGAQGGLLQILPSLQCPVHRGGTLVAPCTPREVCRDVGTAACSIKLTIKEENLSS